MSIRTVPYILAAAVFVAFGVPAGRRPTEAAAPAIAASLCSRLRHHHPCQRRCVRLEDERSGRHQDGHALLPDRSPARQPDVGYRRNSRQRLQGWRLAPEAECLHGRSPAAPATRRDRLHARPTSLIWRSPTTMAITSPTPACSPVPPGSCRRPTGTRSSPRGRTRNRQQAAWRTRNSSRASPTARRFCLNGEDHDVFGDGTVVIKSTPGHTPGHQALFLKLANTGNVLLSGDLYHYPEEITYKKIPSFDTNKEQTAKSREMIEEFVKQNHAQLWIQHDYTSRDQAQDRSRVLRLSGRAGRNKRGALARRAVAKVLRGSRIPVLPPKPWPVPGAFSNRLPSIINTDRSPPPRVRLSIHLPLTVSPRDAPSKTSGPGPAAIAARDISGRMIGWTRQRLAFHRPRPRQIQPSVHHYDKRRHVGPGRPVSQGSGSRKARSPSARERRHRGRVTP